MPRNFSLSDFITFSTIQTLADAKSFERGRAYYRDGAVSRLTERDGELSATVRGTYRYCVEFAVGDDDTLHHACNCPVGDDGAFCKHAVAVALSWLENGGEAVFHDEEREPARPRRKRKTHAELIRDHLGQDDAAAWDAFQGGPVEVGVWPTLAAARAKTHPEDAIALYHRLLPFAVERGAGSARYDEAFGVVRDIHALRVAHRQLAVFDAELDEIRKDYRAKRNFIKLLEKLDA